jgi:hypothetical protein
MPPAQSVRAIPCSSRLSQSFTDTIDTTKSRSLKTGGSNCIAERITKQSLALDDAGDNLHKLAHKLASNDDEPETASSTSGQSAVTEVRTRWPPLVTRNDDTNAAFVPECS